MPIVTADRLTRIGAALLHAAGASEEEANAVAVGCVDARGIRGTACASKTWDELDVEPPGNGRTYRALSGKTDTTFRRLDRQARAIVLATAATGIDELLSAIGRRLRASTSVVSLVVPFDRGDALAMAHREGEVLDESSDEDGWRLRVRLDEGSVGRLAEFVAGDSGETVR